LPLRTKPLVRHWIHLIVPNPSQRQNEVGSTPTKWIIFIDKIASKTHFLLYAARYVRRPPLASWRLLEVTDREVVFVAKDTKTKRLVPTSCQLSDFVLLLAPHVPDSYRHSVRYFGLLSPRARGRMQAALFALLGQCIRPRPQRLSWRDSLRKYFGVDPLVDSYGQTMTLGPTRAAGYSVGPSPQRATLPPSVQISSVIMSLLCGPDFHFLCRDT